MILSPSKNDKFDKAESFKEKAKAVFGSEIGEPIGLGYQTYVDEVNISKYAFKDIILFKFSNCKEFYDRFLSNCDQYKDKSVIEKSKVFLDFLSQKVPETWVQDECNYNNALSIEDEEVTIAENKSYNINDIDILASSFTIQSIHKKYIYEEINLNPNFQRNEIWTGKQKSLLIESLLLNIPIPAFYIDARNSNKWNVIDGLQRLSTILKFINDDFKLGKTEYLKLQGQKFSTLDRKYQRRIEDYALSFNLVRQGTPSEVAFNIFKRINTLGKPLSAQEIRHAMNMGLATDVLEELSKLEEFQKAITLKNYKSLSIRMKEKALILRYLSFILLGYYKMDEDDEHGYSKNNMDAFLIEGMKYLNSLDMDNEQNIEDLNKIKNDFKDSMIKAYTIFEEQSFRKYFSLNESKKAPINIPLFETITSTLRKYSIEEVRDKKFELVNKFLDLFNEKETEENFETGRFIDWITNATNNPDHVRKRFEKVDEVFKEIIGH